MFQAAKFVKTPSTVGTNRNSMSKLFSAPSSSHLRPQQSLTPEEIAALILAPEEDDLPDPGPRTGNLRVSMSSAHLGESSSNLAQGTGKDTGTSGKMSARMGSSGVGRLSSLTSFSVGPAILEGDKEDTESKASNSSRRSSAAKQRLDAGGYSGGVNPFAQANAASGSANPEGKLRPSSSESGNYIGFAEGGDAAAGGGRRRSFVSSASGLSAATESFGVGGQGENSAAALKSQRRRSIAKTLPVLIESSNVFASTDSADIPGVLSDKTRFSFDHADAWYRSGNVPSEPSQAQEPMEAAVQEPAPELSDDERQTLDVKPTRRSSVGLANIAVSESAGGTPPRRKSILDAVHPFPKRTQSSLDEGSPRHSSMVKRTQSDMYSTQASGEYGDRWKSSDDGFAGPEEDELPTVSVENPLSAPNAAPEEAQVEGEAEYTPPAEGDQGYYDEGQGDAVYEENAPADGSGGYYLASDGNYYYYDDTYTGYDYNAEYDGTEQNVGVSADADYDPVVRNNFLEEIRAAKNSIQLRKAEPVERYVDPKTEVLAQIRTGAVALRPVEISIKPSKEQVGNFMCVDFLFLISYTRSIPHPLLFYYLGARELQDPTQIQMTQILDMSRMITFDM